MEQNVFCFHSSYEDNCLYSQKNAVITMNFIRKIPGYLYFAALSIACRRYPQEGRYIEVNGQRLFYAVRGPEDGKPVVLLHGNGGSHRSMLTQAKQLARAGYRVYSPDSRGQGANPPLEEYHYADMAEDTWQFIRALRLEKPAVYGWSDGGILALMLEMNHPGTSSLIALSGANLTPDCGEGFEEFKEWILEQGTPIVMMMLREPDIKPEELEVIQCPALITVGSDEMISVEHTEIIADHIPNSEMTVVRGADHGSYIKRNPRMGRMLLSFFRKYDY